MDLNNLMQSLGPIQEEMQKANEERAKERLQGSAGGGAVKVTLSGDLEIQDLHIAPAAAAAVADDASMLEDLISVAVNDALRQYKQRYGATPDEQLQRSMANSDLASMLGPLMGGMGGMGNKG